MQPENTGANSREQAREMMQRIMRRNAERTRQEQARHDDGGEEE
jgi:hypothetical protein